MSAVLCGVGLGLVFFMLLTEAQGLFFSIAPVALVAVVLALILAVASWSRWLSKVVLCLGLPSLLVWTIVFAYAHILAAGFANVK